MVVFYDISTKFDLEEYQKTESLAKYRLGMTKKKRNMFPLRGYLLSSLTYLFSMLVDK